MSTSPQPVFLLPSWEVMVRDYECDLQGILNNSVYFNYYEHARSLGLRALNLSMSQLAQEGTFLMVSQTTLHYRRAVSPGQTCKIHTTVTNQGIMRLIFHHQLFCEQLLCNEAEATVIAARKGRPQPISNFVALFHGVLPQQQTKDPL